MEFEKALHTLVGILKGVKADQQVNPLEVDELQYWCLLQQDHVWKYPFIEIIPNS